MITTPDNERMIYEAVMRLRKDGTNCNACFVKDCDCGCDTCRSARPHNDTLTQAELTALNMKDALEAGNNGKKNSEPSS